MEEEKKSRKGIFIIIISILLIIILFLIWWFYKFQVVVKYNNGLEDSVLELRFFDKVDMSLLKERLSKSGYNFNGLYETYYLNSNEIEKIRTDSALESNICKNGFQLESDGLKCISIEKFDFPNTRIMKDTIIEVKWDKKLESEPTPIPSKKDTATISLSVSKKCAIGNENIVVTAKIKGHTEDETIIWILPECYKASRKGTSIYTLSRTDSCTDLNEATTKVTAKLLNGKSDTVRFNYEPKLIVKVYDDTFPVTESKGVYKSNKTKININTIAEFKTKKSSSINKITDYSITLNDNVSDNVTITTPCKQTQVVKIRTYKEE